MERSGNLVIIIGERRVECENTEDRQLLFQAKTISEDPQVAGNLSIGRLMLVKDACQKYSLGRLQRIMSQAIKGHVR